MYTTLAEAADITTYPSGETYSEWKDRAVDSFDGPGELVIEAKVRNWTDLMTVISLDDAASRLGGSPTWFIPYFPFARDDRRRNKYSSSELLTAMEAIISANMHDRVIIADPHSYVTERFSYISQQQIVLCVNKSTEAFEGAPVVVIPDVGATHKADTWVKGMYAVQAGKARNKQTGALSGFTLPDYNFEGRRVIIVDDICDGGGTFLGLAEKLKKQGAGPLTLVVTHGLFTKGLQDLTAAFKHVVTFGSDQHVVWKNQYTQIPWQTLYEGAELS